MAPPSIVGQDCEETPALGLLLAGSRFQRLGQLLGRVGKERFSSHTALSYLCREWFLCGRRIEKWTRSHSIATAASIFNCSSVPWGDKRVFTTQSRVQMRLQLFGHHFGLLVEFQWSRNHGLTRMVGSFHQIVFLSCHCRHRWWKAFLLSALGRRSLNSMLDFVPFTQPSTNLFGVFNDLFRAIRFLNLSRRSSGWFHWHSIARLRMRVKIVLLGSHLSGGVDIKLHVVGLQGLVGLFCFL